MLDGRYEILATLGNGAMSVVVAARHLQLRQKVAIKLLRPEYSSNPDVVTRFLREGRAVASLRNEHVVSVSDVGMLPTGVPYLVMEYLEGTDLAAHLAAHGPVSVDVAVEYTFQVLEALAEAHRVGIVHRDIKPANLLSTFREDGSVLIKVLDFGVCKFTGPDFTQHDLTRQGPFLGSPAYMSPEQIRNPAEVDLRTDIWSIGVVLYELVTGQLPFAGRTAAELVTSICSSQPTPIAPLISRMPIELVGVIGRCVHKQRDQRHASVQELARALLPFARTAAARVSVERVLGMQASPPQIESPTSTKLPQRSSIPTVTTDKIVLGAVRPSFYRRLSLGVLGGAFLSVAGYFFGSALLGERTAPPKGAAIEHLATPVPAATQCEPLAAPPSEAVPSTPARETCQVLPNAPTRTADKPSGQTGKRTVRARAPNVRSEPSAPEPAVTSPRPGGAPPVTRGASLYPSRPLDPNPYETQ